MSRLPDSKASDGYAAFAAAYPIVADAIDAAEERLRELSGRSDLLIGRRVVPGERGLCRIVWSYEDGNHRRTLSAAWQRYNGRLTLQVAQRPCVLRGMGEENPKVVIFLRELERALCRLVDLGFEDGFNDAA